jgi:CO/xanthine dehydrogenase FAD-binding subunit
LPPCFRALQEAAREVGSIQIQNAGTIGGNLCNASPAADGVPPLLVLDAEVEIASLQGRRREPLSTFIQGNRHTSLRPGELVTEIIVPRTIDHGRSRFLKLGARRYLVISIVMVAACLAASEDGLISDARVAVGACSAVATRLPALEKALTGKPVCAGLGETAQPEHLAALSPIGDVRATADYRLDAALQLVRQAIEACSVGKTHG